jgi:hypothetical protein
MSGLYQVIGFNNLGCSDTGFVNVDVNPLPTINSFGGGLYCSGSNITLSSNGGQSYLWSGPNGFQSSQQNVFLNNISPSMSGNYFVTGTNVYGCSSSSSLTLNILSGPNVISHPQNQTIGLTGTGNFTIVSSDPNALFQWQTDLGFGFQNMTNSGQYSGVNTNTVTINNVGWNNNQQLFRCIISTSSCSDTSEVGILNVDESLASEIYLNETINLYPNPARFDFKVVVPSSLIGENYELLDYTGRVVQKEKLMFLINQIPVQHFARGAYLIRIGNKFNKVLILD